MAATRIMSIHINKGKTARQCIGERLDYIMNPKKTDGGILVSTYACSPETAADEFMFFRQEYQQNTGRTQENEVIGYHVRQAFKPEEITPEEANEIGKEAGVPDDRRSIRLRRCDTHRQASHPQSHHHLLHRSRGTAQIPGREAIGKGSGGDQRFTLSGTQSVSHSEFAG